MVRFKTFDLSKFDHALGDPKKQYKVLFLEAADVSRQRRQNYPENFRFTAQSIEHFDTPFNHQNENG